VHFELVATLQACSCHFTPWFTPIRSNLSLCHCCHFVSTLNAMTSHALLCSRPWSLVTFKTKCHVGVKIVMDSSLIATMCVVSPTILPSLPLHLKIHGNILLPTIVCPLIARNAMFIKDHYHYTLVAWLWPFCNLLLKAKEVAKVLRICCTSRICKRFSLNIWTSIVFFDVLLHFNNPFHRGS
jgi:hypothetical protein